MSSQQHSSSSGLLFAASRRVFTMTCTYTSVCHHWLLVIGVFFCVLCSSSRATELNRWSQWFNEPPSDLGDNQTLAIIKQLYGYNCPEDKIIGVECRVEGTYDTFSQMRWYNGNYLYPPCNSAGVACSHADQFLEVLSLPCHDFEIRFHCGLEDSTVATTLQNPLSVHGGFIALAAGLSVILPLICVLLIQLRRAKREELRRATQEGAATTDESESSGEGGTSNGPLSEPPPTYEQLFGPTIDLTNNADEDVEAACNNAPGLNTRSESTAVLVDEMYDNDDIQRVSNITGVVNPASDGLEDEEANQILIFSNENQNEESNIATISGNNVSDGYNSLAVLPVSSSDSVSIYSSNNNNNDSNNQVSIYSNNNNNNDSNNEDVNSNCENDDAANTSAFDVSNLSQAVLSSSNTTSPQQLSESDVVEDLSDSSRSLSLSSQDAPVTSNQSSSTPHPPPLPIATITSNNFPSTQVEPPPPYSPPTSSSSLSSLLSPSTSFSSPSSSSPNYQAIRPSPSQSTIPISTSSSSPSSPSTTTQQQPANQRRPFPRMPPMPATSSNTGPRFPGMHVSINEILTAIQERETPPPSYQEALKILKKAEKAKKKQQRRAAK